MSNSKIFGDGNSLTVWFALPNYAVNPAKPTVAELTAALEITDSITWSSFSFGAKASTQTSDPGWGDVGDVKTRGFAQFGGTIDFFYPNNYTDVTDANYLTFAALRVPRTLGYVIIRTDGAKTTSSVLDSNKGPVANDLVNIYKVISDGWADTNTGDVNFKYSITFLPQGSVWTNAMVATAVTVTTPTAIGTPNYSAAVKGKTPLSAYLTGRELAKTTGEWDGTPGWFNWASSDSTKATVDKNGVVTAVAVGGPVTITATDPNSGAVSTGLSITIVT